MISTWKRKRKEKASHEQRWIILRLQDKDLFLFVSLAAFGSGL